MPSGSANRCLVTALLVLAVTGCPSDPPPEKESPITCEKNLRELGLVFRTWSMEHNLRLPFNVSTNEGGSRELSGTGPDGFATNSVPTFQAMTNVEEFTSTLLLVCPHDRSKKPAHDLSNFGTENLSYRLRVGTNVDFQHEGEILLVCPIEGNTLYCDGKVRKRQ
jgi:hypothetical protein